MIVIVVLSLLTLVLVASVAGLAMPLLTRGAPYVPTSAEDVQAALALAKLKPNEIAVDLGSGDGRFVIAAAKKGARAIGYEANPWLVWSSRRKIRALGLHKNAHVFWRSLWLVDVCTADVVFIYIFPGMLHDLEQRFRRELKAGARIVTIAWPLPMWQFKDRRGNVYLYEKE